MEENETASEPSTLGEEGKVAPTEPGSDPRVLEPKIKVTRPAKDDRAARLRSRET
jgi:hypothetical protein